MQTYQSRGGGLRTACAMGAMLFTMNSQAADQYILVNVTGGWKPDEVFTSVAREFKASPTNRVRVGIGAIFSYLNKPREKTIEDLRHFLRLSQEHDVPVVVQFDGENWWGARPELWNWWDQSKPGYNPANRENVEWTGWQSTNAIKISWRNWGRQIRVLPAPNLMSPQYRDACHKEMNVLVPIVLKWWRGLPRARRDLLVGIKVGHETSIGVNSWYYPNGNSLLDKPEKDDPTTGLDHSHLPDRGGQNRRLEEIGPADRGRCCRGGPQAPGRSVPSTGQAGGSPRQAVHARGRLEVR